MARAAWVAVHTNILGSMLIPATRPPLPIYAVVLVAVGGILTLAAVVITIMALAKKRSSIKQRSRAYSVAEGE